MPSMGRMAFGLDWVYHPGVSFTGTADITMIAIDGMYMNMNEFTRQFAGFPLEDEQTYIYDFATETLVRLAIETVTSIISSLNPSVEGDVVTFTAQVAPGGTGSVRWKIDGADVGTTALSNSICSIEISGLAIGDHIIEAIYDGDADYNPSMGSMTQFVQASGGGGGGNGGEPGEGGGTAPSQISISSSANPSAPGVQITFTASVTPGNATGKIRWVVEGMTDVLETDIDVPVQMVFPAAGSYVVNATYLGDTAYATSTASLTEVIQSGGGGSGGSNAGIIVAGLGAVVLTGLVLLKKK